MPRRSCQRCKHAGNGKRCDACLAKPTRYALYEPLHRMGRPLLPPDEVRNQVFKLRFSVTEMLAVVRAAGKAKRTPTEWVRDQVLAKLKLAP